MWCAFYSPVLTLAVITTICLVCIYSAEQSGPICDRGKPFRTTEFQIVEKGIPHWNQRTEASRFRRRSEPSDVSLQRSKGNSVSRNPKVVEFSRNHFQFIFQLRTSWTKLSAASLRPSEFNS